MILYLEDITTLPRDYFLTLPDRGRRITTVLLLAANNFVTSEQDSLLSRSKNALTMQVSLQDDQQHAFLEPLAGMYPFMLGKEALFLD
ncbi:hypothetical protein TNCV_788161 [Trichonephila clavipes]|nr:hypothetical protein TNCV_788161 [Trichonephila clavipes]